MRKTKLLTTIITALMAVSLYGCANVDGEVSSAPSDVISQQTSEMISSLTDSSTDNAISDGETSTVLGENSEFPSKCKIYKQTRKQFSEEQLLSFFRDTPQKGEYYAGNRIHYETAEESGFIDKGMFRYSTQAGGEYGSICDPSFFKENNIKGYEDTVLEFASREEVTDKISSVLEEKFEIKRENWFAKEFYAVKKENFDLYKQLLFEEANKPETSENELELDKLREWAEKLKEITSEDYYYISLGFKRDNISFYDGGGFYFGQDESSVILNYTAYVIYTKKGIESICLINVNETDASSGTETNLISADSAYEVVREKYDAIIFDGDVEIYDMRLVYLSIPQNDLDNYFENFELRPFYAFYCRETGNYEGTTKAAENITYIDAVTGSEFATAPIS